MESVEGSNSDQQMLETGCSSFCLPPPFVFYAGSVPCVHVTDLTFLAQQPEWPIYDKLMLSVSVWEERRAYSRCAALFTFSDWIKESLVAEYDVDPDKVRVTPLPSATPEELIPAELNIQRDKKLTSPLRLLFMGRVAKRKGVDIAIEIVQQLNERGYPAQLTVCGLTSEEPIENVSFVGLLSKLVPGELKLYVALYQHAHLLIHPARFEAGGTVLSDAAALGTPSITNATGGLATTLKDGVSGVLLPKGSPPEDYVQAIIDLVEDPDRYYQLCQTTRDRYETDLTWGIAGKRLNALLEHVVNP